MQIKTIISLSIIFLIYIGCKTDKTGDGDKQNNQVSGEMEFDKVKWKIKEGADYPYREQMFKDIVYNDTVRTLSKKEILDLLGAPNRINENHLYYTISQKRIGIWPLSTKTMVIKLSEDQSIDWIKIHGQREKGVL